MVENDYDDKQVKEDMADDFRKRIGKFFDEIDYIKEMMLTNPEVIVHLKQKIQAVYIYLTRKTNPNEKKLQDRYDVAIRQINIYDKKRVPNDNMEAVTVKTINPKRFNLMKRLLERREIHLNSVLERIGLTATEKTKKRRIV